LNRVFVTGIGIISAIGIDLAENRMALMEGKCGISPISDDFPSRFAGLLPFGGIKISTSSLRNNLNATEPGVTRTTLLALHAVEQALKDSQLTTTQLRSFDTALIGATTVGGMCLIDELYEDAHLSSGGSEYLSSYDAASVNIYIQSRYQLNGINDTINTACSSSANAIMYGTRLLKSGLARRAIVGGVDSLAKFTINGFNSLYILSPDTCAPFDADRKGLNLGEGAAFLVLEREEDCAGKIRYAEVAGYCNANDAFHPSSLSETGDGPYLSMLGALKTAKLAPPDINFINAHGTGTENNDEVESNAMIRLFSQPPPFASTKSNTGHTLGAAGAVEAVYSILNLVNQEVYPGLHFNKPIATTGLVPVQSYARLPLKHVMTNSFGFGGNCTSLIFSKA